MRAVQRNMRGAGSGEGEDVSHWRDLPVTQRKFKTINTIHVGDHLLPVPNTRKSQSGKAKSG